MGDYEKCDLKQLNKELQQLSMKKRISYDKEKHKLKETC